MKRILFLTPQLPYLPISGGVIKSLKLVKYLSARYDVQIISLQKENDLDEEMVNAYIRNQETADERYDQMKIDL